MKLKILFFFLFIPQMLFSYYLNHPCCSFVTPCGWWGDAEYMFLWRKERFYPPLLTTHPTLPPILGLPETSILFGDKYQYGTPQSGFRGELGIWLSRCLAAGISGFTLGEEKKDFSFTGNSLGTPIFGQPFFNTEAGLQDVYLLSFPALQFNGRFEADTNNTIWGFDLYGRYRLLNKCCFTFDFLAGFLYNSLNDSIDINTSTTAAVGPITTNVADNFSTENHFYSGLVGFILEWNTCRFGINLVGKVGLGSMRKQVKIKGTTVTSFLGTVINVNDSGFLAQPSNSGNFMHTQFEALPQINARIKLKIWQHMWAIVGYTYIFWPTVNLAGEQINLNINPSQVPLLIGTPSPIFKEKSSSFWVQGFTLGLHFCY